VIRRSRHTSQSEHTERKIEREAAEGRWTGLGQNVRKGSRGNGLSLSRSLALSGRAHFHLRAIENLDGGPEKLIEIERDDFSAVIAGGLFCLLTGADLLHDFSAATFLDEKALRTGTVSQ
jgi:hypothetical protein